MKKGAVAPALAMAAALLVGAAAPLDEVELRRYSAPWSPEAPAIDGRLDEPGWEDASWTDTFVDIRGDDHPAPLWSTRAKLMWNEEALFIGARMEEPHLWATLTERDAIIYHDHDFEVFLDPDGDGLGYFELEINALGTEFDLFLDKPYRDGGSASIEWDMEGLRSAVYLDGTLNDARDVDQGWSVEIAIPWEDLKRPGGPRGETPQAGDEWRVNFSRVHWPLEIDGAGYRKVAEPTPENRHPEYNWVWSPQGEIDMHIPSMWGRVRFAPPNPGEER